MHHRFAFAAEPLFFLLSPFRIDSHETSPTKVAGTLRVPSAGA